MRVFLTIYLVGVVITSFAVMLNFMRSNPPTVGVLGDALVGSLVLGAVWPLTVAGWILLELSD